MLVTRVLRLLAPDKPETARSLAPLYRDRDFGNLSHLPWAPVSAGMPTAQEIVVAGDGEFVDVVYLGADEFDRLPEFGLPAPNGEADWEDRLFDALDASGRHWAAFRNVEGEIWILVVGLRFGREG